MKDFLIDEELLDFNASVANNGTEIGCPNKQESCRNAPCQHGGMELGIIYSYFMPVCSTVQTITPRCLGRPDALVDKAE